MYNVLIKLNKSSVHKKKTNAQERIMIPYDFKCLMCNHFVNSNQIAHHKQQIPNGHKYAILWPEYNPLTDYCYDIDVPIYNSTVFSKALGVQKVYILDEGNNISGSMKDYLVTKAINLAEKNNQSIFKLASSGNHALSLAIQTRLYGYNSLIFIPESSVKTKHLSIYKNTFIISLKESTYEDVYSLSNQIDNSEIFNANVNNEFLITGF